jgi:hypothetical protein
LLLHWHFEGTQDIVVSTELFQKTVEKMPEGIVDDGGGSSALPSKDTKGNNNSASGQGKNKRQGYQHKPSSAVPRQPKFEGKCDELKGHIYDCSDARQSDQFTKTSKEIAEYAGRTYKHGGHSLGRRESRAAYV